MKTLALLFSCACAGLAVRAATPVTVDYAHVGGVTLKLDACTPDGAGPFPAVILIHGGGWNSGDRTGLHKDKNGHTFKALIAPMEDPLTAAGYVWFSIDYRLVPHAVWPEPMDDVETAIRWVKAHAAEYKVDTTRIVISGESAGGHLALLAAVNPAEDTHVAAAVIFYGPWDLVEQYHFHGDTMGAGMGGLFGSQTFDAPTIAKLKEASPITYAKPGLPPILLLHGDKDVQVPYAGDLAAQSKLQAMGDVCDLITIPGGPHGMVYWNKFDPAYQDKVVAWLNTHLGK